jgi:predicted Zn-dependent protease
MQQYFNDIAAFLGRSLRGKEQYKCWLEAETTDFVRFNRSALRQAGNVRQAMLTVDLIEGSRHAGQTVTLAGKLENDLPVLAFVVEQLREQLGWLPEDPHLRLSASPQSTTHVVPARLPSSQTMVDDILAAAAGYDMVGFLACGPVYRGFANSFGQCNWHETTSFNFDWSLYLERDKAVKTAYAGFEWDSAAFAAKFKEATEQLELLRREPVTVKPGSYRAYLAPGALNELLGMLNWGGLSEKALRTRQSSLRRMRDEGLRLHPALTLRENIADGLAPGFQAEGFLKPPSFTLLERGELAGSMVSPRTAREYNIPANGADADEAVVSMDLAPGTLPAARVLEELGTGLYISNLWYLNYSDRANCRITGMTRFATFWVEDGRIKAPLNVMRFDDSLFRLLGDNLVALTRERELLIDNASYGSRQTASARLPGALVKDFVFVL